MTKLSPTTPTAPTRWRSSRSSSGRPHEAPLLSVAMVNRCLATSSTLARQCPAKARPTTQVRSILADDPIENVLAGCGSEPNPAPTDGRTERQPCQDLGFAGWYPIGLRESSGEVIQFNPGNSSFVVACRSF